MQLIIDDNNNLIELNSKIKNDQKSHIEKFNIIEKELQKELIQINDSKMILENEEIDKLFSIYNQNLNNFNLKIDRFNNHYDKQISLLKKNILNKALEILQNYSIENKIDLILDSNNYILSSNSINITNLIFKELNKITFDTSFEQFK